MDFDLLRDGEQFSNYLVSFNFAKSYIVYIIDFQGHYQDESELDRMHNFSADRIYHWNMDSDIQYVIHMHLIFVSTY